MKHRCSSTLTLAVGAFIALVVGALFPLLAAAQGTTPLQRLPNTTLAMPATPPVYGYTVTNAFGNLSFANPVAIVCPPDETNRLFVVEQGGRVAVITNLAAPTRSVFLDISGRISGGAPNDERGLLGMAFHPGYATNGFFFVFYTGPATTSAGTGLHDIVARFQVSASNPNAADPASELRLIVQLDNAGNHNGGDLHFGPDGYLYIALGDEGGANDQYNNSQRINGDFFAAIARIDVDRRPGSLAPNQHPAATANYDVPPDNPFIGATSFNGVAVNPLSVRTEFWAVGLRNPWRFSFDRPTGLLYCADVGQGGWEEVDIITRGGNYGWAFREGRHPGPKASPPGFSSLDPLYEYSHGSGTNQGFSVTGGVVYRGERMSQLRGSYVFADYVSGHLWALRHDGGTVTSVPWLLTEGGIAGFGVDPRNGDVLVANQTLDTIRRLTYSPNVIGTPLPPTLADTGAFADTAALNPAPGVVTYEVNLASWADHALTTRWFSVPNTNLTLGFDRNSNWLFPTGTVWIQHFELERTNGQPASRQRLETRLLVKNSAGVYGVTYRWGDSTTNAVLVPEEGHSEAFVVYDAGGEVLRTQVWQHPSRQQCLFCHTSAGGYALGFNTPQLNRDHTYAVSRTNQLAAFSQAGYFDEPLTNFHTLRTLAKPDDAAVSAEQRVRSYLGANCAQCHQPDGVPQSRWDARLTTPISQSGIIDGPVANDGGNPDARVVKPGSPANSMLLTRMTTLGPGRMPPLGTAVIDATAVALLSAWLTNDLPSYRTFPDWQVAHFGSTNAPGSGPEMDPDRDGASNLLEYLTGTDPRAGASAWSITVRAAGGGVDLVYPQIANRGFEVQSTDDLASPGLWRALDVPGNTPFFSASNRVGIVTDPAPSAARFYRVRVYEP